MCSLLAFLFPVLTFASRDKLISDNSANMARDEIWTMQGRLLPREGRRDTWKSLSQNLRHPLWQHQLGRSRADRRGDCGWPAPLSLVVNFLIACICCSEPPQAGRKVNSTDLHILLLYYHKSRFKTKSVGPHSKSADLKSQLVKKKWFGFNTLVLSQKRNRVNFWALYSSRGGLTSWQAWVKHI